MSALEVENLRVELRHTGADIVDDVSFAVEAGEILGIVGESGSGKTTVAHALLGHARTGARIAGGSVRIGGEDILKLTPEDLRSRRGVVVSYVAQDPPAALNPALRIGKQLNELLEFHDPHASEDTKHQRALDALSEVSLPTTKEFLRRFPHQLSGGQQQRVVLAMAFVLRPTLVVLDEPTTGLDVTTQAQVLRVALALCQNHDVAAVYVTHDLAVVSQIATRSMVMYSGRICELGHTKKLFAEPAHPYTRRLMHATPDPAIRRPLKAIGGIAARPGQRPQGCFFHPRCNHATARCVTGPIQPVNIDHGHLSWCIRTRELPALPSPKATAAWMAASGPDAERLLDVRCLNAYHGHMRVVKDASLQLLERECHALVGESGSGKTTLARSVIGLHTNLEGEVLYRGQELPAGVRSRSTAVRRRLQYIFQSPYNSLNPRQRVGDIIALPIKFFFSTSSREAQKRAVTELERVGLPSILSRSYPDELSGGERQRVAIARALVCEPDVLICDEITSALDVSVQAAIIDLLAEMQREDGLAMLFITHNLALVRNLADRVTILNDGVIVEFGPTQEVLDNPQNGYTRRLLSDTPTMFDRMPGATPPSQPRASDGGPAVPVAGSS
jgi:peptide/nickel transport system ATP-binding protein